VSQLELELSALARLSADLLSLGVSLKQISESPSATALPDASVDTPSLVAARPVGTETIKDLQDTVANRFIEVAYLVEYARTQFSEAEDNRSTVFANAGSLL
jgi:hypothetical protein